MLLLRAWNWFIKKVGGYSLLAITLLLVALSSVAYGYAEIVRGIETGPATWMAALAVLLAWRLARTRLGGVVITLILSLAGLLATLLVMGELWIPFWAWVRTGINSLIDHLRPDTPQIDPSVYRFAAVELSLGLNALLRETSFWLGSLLDGVPRYNPTAVRLVWGMALWAVSAWAGFFQRRRMNPFLALLPAGVLLIAGLSYTRSNTLSLFPAMFALLSLTALSHGYARESAWNQARIDFPEDTRLENTLLAVGIIIALLATALVVPRLSIRPIIELVQRVTGPPREQVEPVIESFGFVQLPSGQASFNAVLTGGLPRSHLLGSGPDLSEQIFMSVQMRGGIFPEEVAALGVPFYWRALTYDEYTGVGWQSSDTQVRYYQPGELALPAELASHRLVEQEIRFIGDDHELMYAAGELVSANQEFRIGWRSTPDFELSMDNPGDFFGAIVGAKTYQARSWVPLVGEAELRQASGAIPGWILNRYLSLPSTISVRTYALAQEITHSQTNVYDRAHALERYLRNIPYDLNVPEPPPNRDVVEYFLFDLQRGYCDYYATAMVVMARSVGIPARIAVGYAQGTYDRVNDRYLVSQAESHSWVEIYFAGIGWVSFEPTAGLPAIDRPAQAADIPAAIKGIEIEEDLLPWYRWLLTSWQNILLTLVLGGAAGVLLWSSADNWWLRQGAPLETLNRIYRRLYRHGRLLQASAWRGATPYEFSAALVQRLEDLDQHARWATDLPVAIDEIRVLADIYARSLYSTQPAAQRDQWRSIALWQRLRRRLFWARWLQKRIFQRRISQ